MTATSTTNCVASTPSTAATSRTIMRRVAAFTVVAMLHIVLIAASLAATEFFLGRVPAPKNAPLLLAAVAMLMAHCSLTAMWWACTRLASYISTLMVAMACISIWGILTAVLPNASSTPAGAAALFASLATQMILTGLVARLLLAFAINRSRSNPVRYSILFLFCWITAVAILLGGARWLSARFGWTTENFFSWVFFAQFQSHALVNTTLAVSLLACVRLSRDWRYRAISCTVVLAIITVAATAIMSAVFGFNVGLPTGELAWLIVAQGLFLLITLLPLEAIRDTRAAGSQLET